MPIQTADRGRELRPGELVGMGKGMMSLHWCVWGGRTGEALFGSALWKFPGSVLLCLWCFVPFGLCVYLQWPLLVHGDLSLILSWK